MNPENIIVKGEPVDIKVEEDEAVDNEVLEDADEIYEPLGLLINYLPNYQIVIINNIFTIFR